MTHGAAFFSAVSGAQWDDVAPLARVLEVTLSPESVALTPAHGRALWKKLSYLGSNDLAYLLRGFEGVDYPEIVRDVCKHLKISEPRLGEEERVVELNEQLVLGKIFADAWEHLDTDERRELLRDMNLDAGHLSVAGAGVAAAVLAGKAGPFAIYKLSVVVANSVARALPARGLAPARRKTVHVVALVASLRQAKRTALAETALAETPVQTPMASAAQRAKAKRSAPKKAARRPAAPEQRAPKKAAKLQKATPKRNAKKAPSKKASARQKPAKQTSAKQTPAKKAPAKKAPAKQKPAKQKPAKQKPAKQKPAKQKPAKAS